MHDRSRAPVISLPGRGQLAFVAPADQRGGAGFGELVRGGQADARRAAGDQHHLAGHLALQACGR